VTATKAKVNFRFHNPNTDDETLKVLVRIFTEVSRTRLENMLRESVMINTEKAPKIEVEPP